MTTLREAAQQALEAMDNAIDQLPKPYSTDCAQAITALRAALAQQEQTCNCRWVGDVQTQQCTLHEAHVDAIHEWAERAKTAEAKLAQQEQEQGPRNVEEIAADFGREFAQTFSGKRTEPEQEQEPVAWPEGYEPHELPADYTGKLWIEGQVRRLYEAALEQEPVAWMVYTQDGKSVCVTDNPADFIEWRSFPLYTHPPRREWVGLTDEEIDAALPHEPGDLDFACARAIEQALRRKNHD